VYGNIDVRLLSDEAPNTVANFLTYVDSGAYNIRSSTVLF